MFSKSNCSDQCINPNPKQGTQILWICSTQKDCHTRKVIFSHVIISYFPAPKDILVHQQKTIVICASHSNALWGIRWVWAGQEGCMGWWRRRKRIFCCGGMREETITLCCCGQDIHQPTKQRHQASDRRIIFHNWQKNCLGWWKVHKMYPGKGKIIYRWT